MWGQKGREQKHLKELLTLANILTGNKKIEDERTSGVTDSEVDITNAK